MSVMSEGQGMILSNRLKRNQFTKNRQKSKRQTKTHYRKRRISMYNYLTDIELNNSV